MIMLVEVQLMDNVNISIPRTIYLVQKSCLVHQRFLNISFRSPVISHIPLWYMAMGE